MPATDLHRFAYRYVPPAWFFLSGAAQASVIISIDQFGPNVVATGSGTVNLGLTNEGDARADEVFIWAEGSRMMIGSTAGSAVDWYGGIVGPASFGFSVGSVPIPASSGSDSIFGLCAEERSGLWLPRTIDSGYVSGSAFSGTSTWNGQTLASLGLTPGTYRYTWGSGGDAGFLVLQIGPAVPEPVSWSLMAGACGLIALLRRRRTQSR